jgi:preprotein translocase subunit SecF
MKKNKENKIDTVDTEPKNKIFIDFIGKRKLFFTISIILVVLSLLMPIFGVKVAIEFKGGTVLSYNYSGEIDTAAVENAIDEDVTVRTGESLSSGMQTMSVSFVSNEGLTIEKQTAITNALKEINDTLTLESSSDISPTAGRTFFLKCLVATALAVILLLAYIALRFKSIAGWASGFCAILALLIDVVITFGVYVALGFEINTNFIAVILTVLAYCINDTIIIFDRLRENRGLHDKMGYKELVNLSINQTLFRSIMTASTVVIVMTVVAVCAVVMQVDTILSFAVPMLVGVAVGAYTSVCITATLWEKMMERKA